MTEAYRCNECGAFHEGRPALQISISLDINGQQGGVLGQLFNPSDGNSTVDLCGVECYQELDLNYIRDEMLADLDNKHELLDADADVQPEVEVTEND